MQTPTRAHNLFLARSLIGTERGQLETLKGAVSQATLQRQVKNEKPISNADAVRYAKGFGLPPDWFDRDNEQLLRMSEGDYRLVTAVLQLQAAQKEGLLSLLEP